MSEKWRWRVANLLDRRVVGNCYCNKLGADRCKR